ncbi:MAG: 30S ribosome-binding factor RbfA [Candidatus Eisenbacteria bacterium]|uniref:Ribosome-binding factor A n=1 Tax=Eiseniibacteriota bacterium TaxID=2212470 RepID=A0A956M2W3_UNCEI|nr:30S ribosome-binding factor RbfA [Candidatus Eisenbacteria bacterium]
MAGNRIERVQEEIRRELSDILQQRAHDPRLAWVSVIRVEVAGDFAHAKVYVSSLGDEKAQQATFQALQKAGPFLRTELGRRLHLRRTPELHFQEDHGIEASVRISQMLDDLVPPSETSEEGES